MEQSRSQRRRVPKASLYEKKFSQVAFWVALEFHCCVTIPMKILSGCFFPPSIFSGLKPSPLTMRRHWADNGLRFHEL